MTELIKITEKDGKQAVSARELHKFLEATERFNSWFERQLQFGFIDNQDYTGVKSFTLVNNGAERELDDYALTIDCAKEISMLQRNDKGKEARQYFIACEKKLQEVCLASYQIEDPIKRAERWIEEEKERQSLLLEAKTATERVHLLIHNGKNYTSGEIAKELGMRSAMELNKILSDKGIQFKQNGTWLLYAKYADEGYTSVKQQVLDSGKIIFDRQWSGKGRDFIINLLKK